jgi:hypothetical protein
MTVEMSPWCRKRKLTILDIVAFIAKGHYSLLEGRKRNNRYLLPFADQENKRLKLRFIGRVEI